MESVFDTVTGQETQLAALGTTERVLYTVQSIRKVLHYDASQKEPESYGGVWKLREAGGMHRPELDGTRQKGVEYAGNYSIVQDPGSVNPYSYPCRHVRASDLWCRRQSDVTLRQFSMDYTILLTHLICPLRSTTFRPRPGASVLHQLPLSMALCFPLRIFHLRSTTVY